MYYKTLRNGVVIPMLGFGTLKAADQTAVDAVKMAIESGYRHIDTAKSYQNEVSVGEGIRASGIKREELFITDKLHRQDTMDRVCRKAFLQSLEDLGLDYLDLYLIHFPVDGYIDAWLEIEQLYKEGKIRAIGVSNFHKQHFDKLAQFSTIKPMVNQIESNPYFNNNELIDYCVKEDIIVEGWSPFAGFRYEENILEDPTIIEIAKKYDKTTAQVIIRWELDRDVIVFPKSSNEIRMKQNFDVFDFKLDKEDIELINSLDKDKRSGVNPNDWPA